MQYPKTNPPCQPCCPNSSKTFHFPQEACYQVNCSEDWSLFQEAVAEYSPPQPQADSLIGLPNPTSPEVRFGSSLHLYICLHLDAILPKQMSSLESFPSKRGIPCKSTAGKKPAKRYLVKPLDTHAGELNAVFMGDNKSFRRNPLRMYSECVPFNLCSFGFVKKTVYSASINKRCQKQSSIFTEF